MYSALNSTGFKHSQIEAAMSAVVGYGGDLLDALDWLCLHTPNGEYSTLFRLHAHGELQGVHG